MIAIDDKDILQMLHNRDEQALRETEQRYGAHCRALARDILRSGNDAEECVNDALMRIWESIPPASPENYYAYLLRTVRNLALNRLRDGMAGRRGAGRTAVQLEEIAGVLAARENTETEFDRRELLAAVTRFLQGLPPKQRNLFIRRYWRMAGYAELARDFGMTENNVQVLLCRVRKKLQKFLIKEGLL